jgi:hypothetical protein
VDYGSFLKDIPLGWRQDNENRSNQESKFDFLATHQCLVQIDEGQQKMCLDLPLCCSGPEDVEAVKAFVLHPKPNPTQPNGLYLSMLTRPTNPTQTSAPLMLAYHNTTR